jgi:two-component system cell cycle sensor histidine kinase/response regulator CckA
MPIPLKILFAEDNPNDAELEIAELCKAGFEPDWKRVDTELAFLENLNESLDLVISDYQMPGFGGLRALELLKKSGLDIPFILVSGTIGEDIAVKAMKAGASDYLMKDRLTRLGQATTHALGESQRRKERRKEEQDFKLFRALVDQSNDSFEVIDPSTARFIDVNEKGLTSLGYSRTEFLALRVLDVYQTIQAENWPTLLKEIRVDGSLNREGVHRRKDGSTFPVEFNIKWVKLDRDYLVAVVRDISERKEMEAKMYRAQRMDSIGSIASGIAHDMNNILAPILMAAPMLRMGMSPENTARTLATIEKSAQRGADLVRQLLTFGQGTEGARMPIKFDSLVREMVTVARQTFPKNIVLVENVANDLGSVIGDSTQLHQVLLNLCVNARDAMPQGGTLTLDAECVQFDQSLASMTPGASPGPYIRLQVSDTGTGISPKIVDRIFDPFFTTKGEGKGTGLGLSMVIGIAKNHGGFVSLITSEGKGSTFQVYLPMVQRGDEAAAPDAAAPAPRGNGEVILVVDDEETIREVICGILESKGYRAISACDGADATSKFVLHRAEIKAVITDLEMPVMDGLMLIRVLRGIDPSLAVLVSSGIASRQGIASRKVDLEALGVKNFLRKPYTAEKILHAIRETLDGKSDSSGLGLPEAASRT